MTTRLNTTDPKTIPTEMHYQGFHEDSTVGSESKVYSVGAIDDDFPITAGHIGKETLVDPVLRKIRQFVMSDWPEYPKEPIKPYYNRRNELSCEQNCVLWGTGVISPPSLELRC